MSVSAVITCYNLESFIGEAIDSARQAMRGIGGEIIVVDDCSTDGSSDVIKMREIGEVRYIRTEHNRGVMLATLAGIATARHSVIAFLDGDDVWAEAKIRAALDAFKADDRLAFVTHDLQFVDAAGKPTGRTSRPSQTMPRTPTAQWSDHLRRSVLEHRDDIWLGSALSVHRERAGLDAFGDWVRSRHDAAEMYQDWPLATWTAAQPACRLGYIPEKLFSYRLHGQNHSGGASDAARALRNFTRNANTLRAMVDIVSRTGKPSAKLRADLHLAEAQVALYRGHNREAIGSYLAALPSLISRPAALAKEAARLAAVALLGQARGQKLLQRAARA